MDKQATINIGTVGHVAHGKSTIVQCISGRSTIKYKQEQERNITIKLGYANAKIYKCGCERPKCYKNNNNKCNECLEVPVLVRHVSFVDCPGHEVLMATMLTGTAIMDSAILLVAADEQCPQPQTTEHLLALEVMGLKNIMVLQNKIDLVSKEQALEQYNKIQSFMDVSNVEGPVVPVSGMRNINIDAIMDYIVNYIKEPVRDENENPRMVIIRSFDINRAGCKASDIKGGVLGGSLISGILNVGDEIEIRPGLIKKDEHQNIVVKPFKSKIKSLFAEKTPLERAQPGGLIGVGTDIDPFYIKGDRMIGMVLGYAGTLPPVFSEVSVDFDLLRTVSDANSELDLNETVLLNIGSTSVPSIVSTVDGRKATFTMDSPCCCSLGEIIAISKKIFNNWRLIGHGKVLTGLEVPIE